MFRKLPVACLSMASALLAAAAGDNTRLQTKLTATDIVSRNVEARGGLNAWRAVQTMSLAGKLGAGGNQRDALTAPIPGKRDKLNSPPPRPTDEVFLPFVMELKRPRKMRFELVFKGETAVQVFDGANGWKLRPFLNRHAVEPYTADEMKMASMQADLDGPLVDYAAKGTKVELAGMEKVEDRDSYKLKLTLKNGDAIHVWIDAQTFLEQKIQGQPRRLDGVDHQVEVYFRDFRPVSGLQIPYVLETKVLPVTRTALGMKDPAVPSEKTMVEKVLVNPKLDETLFAKPDIKAVPTSN